MKSSHNTCINTTQDIAVEAFHKNVYWHKSHNTVLLENAY